MDVRAVPPDGRPDRPRLDAGLLGGLLGFDVRVVDALDSTNAEVARLARDGAPAGTVVVAEHQSAGRGRLDRSWTAPARSALTFSVLWRPTALPGAWPWLPLLAGYAVHRVLSTGGFASELKWPNDVLIGERKVAGLLVERVDSPGGPAAVVGIGLNVSMSEGELPVPSATSLVLSAGAAPDRTELLVDLLESLRLHYDRWETGLWAGGPGLRSAYADACGTLGRAVRAELPDGSAVVGRATGIDSAGRLVVATAAGARSIGAGDVVHIRAAE